MSQFKDAGETLMDTQGGSSNESANMSGFFPERFSKDLGLNEAKWLKNYETQILPFFIKHKKVEFLPRNGWLQRRLLTEELWPARARLEDIATFLNLAASRVHGKKKKVWARRTSHSSDPGVGIMEKFAHEDRASLLQNPCPLREQDLLEVASVLKTENMFRLRKGQCPCWPTSLEAQGFARLCNRATLEHFPECRNECATLPFTMGDKATIALSNELIAMLQAGNGSVDQWLQGLRQEDDTQEELENEPQEPETRTHVPIQSAPSGSSESLSGSSSAQFHGMEVGTESMLTPSTMVLAAPATPTFLEQRRATQTLPEILDVEEEMSSNAAESSADSAQGRAVEEADDSTSPLTLLQHLRDDKEKLVEENQRLTEQNAFLNQNNLQLHDEKEVILNQNNQLLLKNQSLMNQLRSEQSFQGSQFQHIQSLQDQITQLRQDLRQEADETFEAAEDRQEIHGIGLPRRNLNRAVRGRSFDLHENNNSEGTGSTTNSQEGRARAAGEATYHETKHRVKQSARTGERFTQTGQLIQYLLQQGADPANIRRVQQLNNERVDTFHQPFDDEDSQWPDGLQIDDLRSPDMQEDYRQRLSRHCVCFVSEAASIMRGGISALLTTRGLAVSCREKVGHTKEGQSLVTVAFEQVAEARTVCQSEEIQQALFEHLGVLVRPLRLDRPSDRPNQDIDPARTVWFKNHYQIDLSANDLTHLAERYGALARPGVVIKRYWDHQQRASVDFNTEVAFQGFIQFADRDGAQRLLADRRQDRNHHLGAYYWNVSMPDGRGVIAFIPDRLVQG